MDDIADYDDYGLEDDEPQDNFHSGASGDAAMEEVEEEEEDIITKDSSDPDRRFCPRCTNMWGPWENKRRKKLMLKCRNCKYQEVADGTKPVYENYIVKQLKNTLDTISPSMAQDPTLYHARIEGGCKAPTCPGQEAVLFQAESGTKANSLKLVFVCKTCGHKWINT